MPQVRILSPQLTKKSAPQLTSTPLRKGRFFIVQGLGWAKGAHCFQPVTGRTHDFLSIVRSVLTGFDNQFGIDSLKLRLRLELFCCQQSRREKSTNRRLVVPITQKDEFD
jgi:hypothetical protein